MHPALAAALEPVTADIRATGAPEPDVRDHDWSDGTGLLATATMWAADGTAIGVRVVLDAPPAAQVAEVADLVQEWVIEQSWRQGTTNWPRCPRHPTSHPLRADVGPGGAVWRCPAGPGVAVPIGSLRAE